MARRRRQPGGGPDPGFMEGIKDKFSAILGKISSLADFSKPVAAPAQRKSEIKDSPESFATAVAEIVKKGYFPHLGPHISGGAAQAAAPTSTGRLPTPKSASPAEALKSPPSSRAGGIEQIPSWLQYQISLSQHTTPPEGKRARGPVMPKAARRGAKLASKLKSAASSFFPGLSPSAPVSQTVSSIAGGAKNLGAGLSGLGGAAGAAGGAVSAIAGPVAFAAAIFKGTEALRGWTHHLHEANMHFAEFSASMTRVEVESQIRNIMLSRERGERRAESAQFLAEQSDALSRSLAPIEDFGAMVKNRIFGGLAEVATGFFEMGKKITGFNAAIGEKGAGTGPGQDYVRQFMKDLEVEKWHEKYGRPARFNNAGTGGTSGADFGGRDF